MAFTAQDVKALREQTGCGMMDCKKALTEADGDFDKAIELLREKGLAAQTKKAGRIAAEGMVYAEVDKEKKVGVVIEVNAETDFVAKNDKFKSLVYGAARAVIDENPADVDALLKCSMEGGTVESALQERILVIGENMKIRRFVRYEGDCVAYIHGGGTHAVLVKFDTDLADKPEFETCGKDVAMQIAAVNPSYVDKENVPAEVIENEKKILLAQISNDPKLASKPDQVKTKMVEGRIGKFYKENCLLEQPFVKDDKISVGTYLANCAKEMGGKLSVVSFVRYEKGEGIEKKQENFAEEIANMVK
ncbi:MAG TPA: translation elongation factor Ts [Candidatus Pygmaiobacter gallistercoris]|nr:translation elongation factor Ts [Candidatus Pygmaiobacter gallistercoris]